MKTTLFSRLGALSLLLAAATPSFAQPLPTEPSPTDVFNEGGTCHIQWNADTTGTWKTMYIELMTGPNDPMVHLKTVATVDGTDPTNTSYDYPCYSVIPNSAIYFYQFTSPGAAPATPWTGTGRFTIAGPNGETTLPPNATQPNGDAKPWGTGALADPSLADSPPDVGAGAGGSAGGNNGTESSGSGGSLPSSTPNPSSPGSSKTPAPSKTASSTSSASSATKSSAAMAGIRGEDASVKSVMFGFAAVLYGFAAAVL